MSSLCFQKGQMTMSFAHRTSQSAVPNPQPAIRIFYHAYLPHRYKKNFHFKNLHCSEYSQNPCTYSKAQHAVIYMRVMRHYVSNHWITIASVNVVNVVTANTQRNKSNYLFTGDSLYQPYNTRTTKITNYTQVCCGNVAVVSQNIAYITYKQQSIVNHIRIITTNWYCVLLLTRCYNR